MTDRNGVNSGKLAPVKSPFPVKTNRTRESECMRMGLKCPYSVNTSPKRSSRINASMVSKQNAPGFALWMSRVAVAFPFGAVGAARLHYALTSNDLSKRTEAWLLLLTFPLCLACVFDLVLASRSAGRPRVAIIVWSIVGIILNVGFFIAAGTSY